jgi:hypothetical protein
MIGPSEADGKPRMEGEREKGVEDAGYNAAYRQNRDADQL